jgi:hypothetical protein
LYTISGIISAALAAVLWKRSAALWLKIFLVCFALFAFGYSDGKHEFDLLKLSGLALLGTFGLTFWKSIIDRIRAILGFKDR